MKRLLRPMISLALCVVALCNTGCLVDTAGLRQVVADLDKAADKTTGEAHKIVTDLRAAVKDLLALDENVREKTLPAWLEKNKELLKAAARAWNDGLIPLRVLPADLQDALQGASKKMSDDLLGLLYDASPRLRAKGWGMEIELVLGNEDAVRVSGTVLTYQASGAYHLAVRGKDPGKLTLKIRGTCLSPDFTRNSYAVYRIPAKDLDSLFPLTCDGLIAAKVKFSLSRGKEVKSEGQLALLPRLGTRYWLVARNSKGRRRAVWVNQGQALLNCFRGAVDPDPLTTAAKQGRVDDLSRQYLAFGRSWAMLADDETFEMQCMVDGKPVTLSELELDAGGIRVWPLRVPLEDGKEGRLLVIRVGVPPVLQ